MSVLDDWNKLDSDHKKFVLRVRNGGGGKHAAEPHSIESAERCDPPNDEYFKSIALWDKAEASGFIECIGSYKWITTDKYSDLELHVFEI
jgi:hypothetical protein